MKQRRNRRIERGAVNAARSLFESCDYVFVEIDLANDFGKDAIVELFRDQESTGKVVALQIKGGRSYRRTDGFAIRLDDEHYAAWRASNIPVIGIVHDPDSNNLYWISITRFLANCTSRPKSIPISVQSQLTPNSLQSTFLSEVTSEIEAMQSQAVLDLLSDSDSKRMQAIIDCFALGRNDARHLIALRYLLSTLEGDELEQALGVLSLATPHPDVFWSKHNWIGNTQKMAVVKHCRWRDDEVYRLLQAVPWERWQRGDLGQSLYMLLMEDPEIGRKMRVALSSLYGDGDLDATFTAAYLLLYWAGENGREAYAELVHDHPLVASIPLMSEVRWALQNFGYLSLFE
jgi:hypothetical protein